VNTWSQSIRQALGAVVADHLTSRWFPATIRAVLIAISSAVSLAGMDPTAAVAAQVERAWKQVDCPFDVSRALLPVTCGRLEVPENYETPGRSIEIAFMIVEPRRNVAAETPVLYLSGGPGAPSLVYAEMLVATPAVREVVVDRNWVFFDQRGAGRSVPSLACPRGDDSLSSVKACRDSLIDRGVDLSQYNSARSARDMEELRKALGVRQWNLWGTSYGSKLAFTMARSFPASVRAIVHDGAAMPENQELVDDFRGTEVALDKLLAKCAADSACSSRFPALRSRFLSAINRLREQPVSVEKDRIDDGRVLQFIRNSLFSAGSAAHFERRVQNVLSYMDAAARRDGALMVKLEHNTPGEDRCEGRSVPIEGRFSLGQYLSIGCNEEKPFESMEEYRRAADRSEIVRALLGREGGIEQLRQCALWPSGRADEIENTHVSYDGPQLVFSGELDPSLSGLAGHEIGMLYANARHVVFRNAAHVQVEIADCPPAANEEYRLCALGLARQFLADPRQALDTRCAEARSLRLVRTLDAR
jgi:pimeloyl-ACP methyl ester carboxylesterase